MEKELRDLISAAVYCDKDRFESILSSEWYRVNCVRIIRKVSTEIKVFNEKKSLFYIVNSLKLILEKTKQSPIIEKLRIANVNILNLIERKFIYSDSSFHPIPDSINIDKDLLEDASLTDLDKGLLHSLIDSCDYRFTEFLRFGANPKTMLKDGKNVWNLIEEGYEKYTLEAVYAVSKHEDIDIFALCEKIIRAAAFRKFREILLNSEPCTVKTRVVYTSRHSYMCGDDVTIESFVDETTKECHTKILYSLFEKEMKIHAEDKELIKKFFAADNIETLMNLEIEPTHMIIDGMNYNLKIITSKGCIKNLECDNLNIESVPQMMLLENIAKNVRHKAEKCKMT